MPTRIEKTRIEQMAAVVNRTLLPLCRHPHLGCHLLPDRQLDGKCRSVRSGGKIDASAMLPHQFVANR